MIRLLIVSVMWALASTASAHSMGPGYEKNMATGNSTIQTYDLSNEFEFPITLRIDVFEKDGVTPSHGWESSRRYFKMVSGSKKQVAIDFDTSEERKVIVCSVLDKVGFDEQEPTTITRVCSRLWLYK